jgi:dynein light intermediate chain
MEIDNDNPETRESLVEFLEPELVTEENKQPKTQNGAKKANQLTDVLNAILPPRQYMTGDGTLLQQKVSPSPSSRESVINLQMKLDERLQERQARENGICPVREELYSQCFDELIRQVTIESPERGLLLLRVRDEVRMTIAAYQTLYQSSITFGMRKTLQAEKGNSEAVSKIADLETERDKLAALLQDHKGLFESIEKRIAERKAIEEKKMAEEKDFLKFQESHLQKFIQDNNQ